MIDQDEFEWLLHGVIDNVTSGYLHQQISNVILQQIKLDFLNVFALVGDVSQVTIEVEVDPYKAGMISIDFKHGSRILTTPAEIYNCLVYNNPTGLRLV